MIERTTTMNGGIVVHWLNTKKPKTTSEWAMALGVSRQGALRILKNLATEKEFTLVQCDDLRWRLLPDKNS